MNNLTPENRNLSSLIRLSQLKTDSSVSSKSSLHSNRKNVKSFLTIRNKNVLADTIDFNYVNQEARLHKQAQALINKPNKYAETKSTNDAINFVDLQDYEDPHISVKLNNFNTENSKDESDKVSLDSQGQKNIQNKLFSNIIKDYDMTGIAPILDSQPIKNESKHIESDDELNDHQKANEPHTNEDEDDNDFDRLVHFESNKIHKSEDINKPERRSSLLHSGNSLKTKKSRSVSIHSASHADKKQSKKSAKKSLNRKPSNPVIRKYFRHQVRIVIALIKIVEFAYSKTSKKYLQVRRMDKVTELVHDVLRKPQNFSQQYLFNKDYYKPSKQTDCSKEVQFILTTPPEMRTFEQIKLVRVALLSIKAFQEYPINMLDKICQCAYYQKIDSKRVIIRQGQIADSFYFILTGKAMVTVMEQDKVTEEIKNRIATIIKDGACFGELAFIYSTTRTATVSSLSDMELISIGREDFFDIFMTNNKGEEPEHIKYLRACSFIKYWPIEKLIDYPQHCHYHYYKRGQVIVNNSLHCDYIYIIKSGVCQVLKKLNDVKPRRILSARIPQIKEEFICSSYKPKVDTGLPFKRGKTAGLSSKREKTPFHWPPNNRESEPKPIFLLMQLLKEGEVFGLDLLKFDETDNDYPNPDVSLVSQGAEVLMLNMEYFLRYSNDDVKDNIRQMMQVYPCTEEMQRRLQHEADWTSFKNETLSNIYTKSKKY